MSSRKGPRRGSLQFYPRKRAAKRIHSVNWKPISGEGILGFLTYKVGMGSAVVKDNTNHSMTKGKRITIPVTILEAPSMKILSVRFYKNGVPMKEVIVSSDKELKKKVKLPKAMKDLDAEVPEGYEDIKLIVYSIPKQTSIKKKPDFVEVAVSAENKLEFVKGLIGKEISITDFVKYDLLDVRGLTKGKGLQGPVKRFGVSFRQHKSEKGVRKVGSIGPWHPAHVTFRVPMAGQLGLFSRVHYNQKVITSGKIAEKDINKKEGFRHYGKIKSGYIVVKGSVQGPRKSQIVLTPSFRKTKSAEKQSFEFVELA